MEASRTVTIAFAVQAPPFSSENDHALSSPLSFDSVAVVRFQVSASFASTTLASVSADISGRVAQVFTHESLSPVLPTQCQ